MNESKQARCRHQFDANFSENTWFNESSLITIPLDNCSGEFTLSDGQCLFHIQC